MDADKGETERMNTGNDLNPGPPNPDGVVPFEVHRRSSAFICGFTRFSNAAERITGTY
jgi:hypothetical protein